MVVAFVGKESGGVKGELEGLAVGHCQCCARSGGNGPTVGLFERIDVCCDLTC